MRMIRSTLATLLMMSMQVSGVHAYYPFPNNEKGTPPPTSREIENGFVSGTIRTNEIEIEVEGEEDISIPLPTVVPVVEPELDVPVLSNSKKVTRAEVIKIAINTRFSVEDMRACFLELSPSQYWLLFADVPVGSDYSVQLCTAMQLGAVDGYSNGMFHPEKEVNLAEASKMIAQAFSLKVNIDPNSRALWYVSYVNALKAAGVDVYKYGKINGPVTYETITKIVNQLKANEDKAAAAIQQ